MLGVQFENYKLFFEPQNHDWLELSRIRMTHPGNFVNVLSSAKHWEKHSSRGPKPFET